jgi:hypothetical protein
MSKRNIKHSYNRILEISEDAKQITMPDSRYYRRNGKYYPSITYVLQYYPKGKFFEDWLKKVGYSSEHIVKKAGEEGTQVHEMIEDYLNGKELNFLNSLGNPAYNPDVWQMFLRFVDFWETYDPKLIETEVHLFSDELKVAGTCDMVCEIDNELWVIDFKTSIIYKLHTIYKQLSTLSVMKNATANRLTAQEFYGSNHLSVVQKMDSCKVRGGKFMNLNDLRLIILIFL